MFPCYVNFQECNGDSLHPLSFRHPHGLRRPSNCNLAGIFRVARGFEDADMADILKTYETKLQDSKMLFEQIIMEHVTFGNKPTDDHI